MVYTLTEMSINENLAEELQKPVIKKFKKGQLMLGSKIIFG